MTSKRSNLTKEPTDETFNAWMLWQTANSFRMSADDLFLRDLSENRHTNVRDGQQYNIGSQFQLISPMLTLYGHALELYIKAAPFYSTHENLREHNVKKIAKRIEPKFYKKIDFSDIVSYSINWWAKNYNTVRYPKFKAEFKAPNPTKLAMAVHEIASIIEKEFGASIINSLNATVPTKRRILGK